MTKGKAMTTDELPTIEIGGRTLRPALYREENGERLAFDMSLPELIALVAALPDEQFQALLRSPIKELFELFKGKAERAEAALAAATSREGKADLPDVGEPGRTLDALAWERDFREETHEFRVVGVARLLTDSEEPIAIRIPANGIDEEEARWLAAALLKAAELTEDK